MENLFVLRGRVQEIYAERSKIIDKTIQFILALVTFFLINKNIGFMKSLTSPVVAVGLALICTFLPLIMTVIAASVLMLIHAYAVSLGVLAVTALVFLILYIFYFRISPGKAFVLLLTPIAFALKIPYIIPAAFALVSVPSAIIPILSGTIVYFLTESMKKASALAATGEKKAVLDQITGFARQVFQNKELWVVAAAIVISFFVIYAVRRQSVDHAWKIAIVSGAVVYIIIRAVGDIAFGIHTSYVPLIIGSVVAAGIGLVLELFIFSVDYARSESLQYEDDEYYYYVKAIPKISVATPEKTVKRINERQETEIIDTEEVRNKASRQQGQRAKSQSAAPSKRPAVRKGSAFKESDMSNTEQILLRESLKRDLELGD